MYGRWGEATGRGIKLDPTRKTLCQECADLSLGVPQLCRGGPGDGGR